MLHRALGLVRYLPVRPSGCTIRRPGRFRARVFACLGLLLTGALLLPPAAHGTAKLTILALPAGFMADNATEAAVLCAITNGYANNIYAVKGTFSAGDLPYYGLTYAPQTTLWASQKDTWSAAQMKVQTDGHGAWLGYLFVRLEATAPRGAILFRFSAVPLSPISNPGPTVSDWYDTYSLDPADTGGWLYGHVFRDPACTTPASTVVVVAEDAFGRVLSAYLSQNSRVVDGEDRDDLGFVRLGAPKGTVTSITGRTRLPVPDGPAGTVVPLYTRGGGGFWTVRAGQSISFDEGAWGDADGDGELTIADATEVMRAAAGWTEPDAAFVQRADVHPDAPDGVLTLSDATALLCRVALNR